MKVVVIRSFIKRASFLLIVAAVIVVTPSAFAQKSRPAQKRRPPAMSAQKQAEFNKLSKEADTARESGRLEDAIVLYSRALGLKRDWIEGWWYMGAIFYERGRYVEGAEALKVLLSIQDKNGPAWAMLGLCEFQLRNYDQSLADLQYGRSLGLGNNKALINVARFHSGLLMTRAGMFELGFDALRDFAREGNESLTVMEALGINALRMPLLPSEMPPDRRELVLLAGRAAHYHAARRVQEAQVAFQELINRYPNTPNVHYSYAVFLLIDTHDTALEHFRKELEISPTHVEAMLQISFEYIKRNDFEAAKPFAERAVKTAPNQFAAHNALGRVLLGLDQVEEAIRELEIGVKQAPDSPEMRYALARAYAKAGRREDAARERAKFLELDKQVRSMREGSQSVGGVEVKPTDKNPPQQ
jgi:tetratricopeptide (TPR) repeat protein